MTTPRDSAWTYLRKYRHDHPSASLEAQQEATEAGGYVIRHRLTPPAPETQFACYNPLVLALGQGQTLALDEIRLLLPQVNLALHQDERFYDLIDGSWYLASQNFVNDRLIAYLSAIPSRETELLAFIENQGGTQAWTVWASDPRLNFQGTTVRLRIQPEDVDTSLLSEAQAWLHSQTQVMVAETTHPTYPTSFWQAALQLALQQGGLFTQIEPGYWLLEVPSAPSLEDFELIPFPMGETFLFSPPFPDPPCSTFRANARFTLDLSYGEVRLGYLPIPGSWQGAFNNRCYPLTWTMGDQITHLQVWTEGGLLYGADLHLRLLWAGVGGKLTIEKWSTGEIFITEHPRQEPLPSCFTLAELHQAQNSTLWQGLTDGVARATTQLQAHWQNMLDRDLTLAETQEALLTPDVGRNAGGFYWQAVDWPPLAPLVEPELTSADPVLSDLFGEPVSVIDPLAEPELASTDLVLSDLFSEPVSVIDPLLELASVDPVLSDLFDESSSVIDPLAEPELASTDPVLSDLFGEPVLVIEPLSEVELASTDPVLSDLFSEPVSVIEPLAEVELASADPPLSDLFDEPAQVTEPLAQVKPEPEDLVPQLVELFSGIDQQPELNASFGLADLFTAEEPTVDANALVSPPDPTIPSSWASLAEHLSALEHVTPPLTRRQSWAMLVQDLKPYLDFNEFTTIQRLWDGQAYLNLMVIRAKTMAFWRSQLPLALLPTQGSLETFQEALLLFYDCSGRDPQPALVHLILPALGYQQVGEQWIWTNVFPEVCV